MSQENQITQDQWNIVNQEYIAIKATFNARNRDLATAAEKAVLTLSKSDPNYTRLVNIFNGFGNLVTLLKAQSETIKKIIADLANKISTT